MPANDIVASGVWAVLARLGVNRGPHGVTLGSLHPNGTGLTSVLPAGMGFGSLSPSCPGRSAPLV